MGETLRKCMKVIGWRRDENPNGGSGGTHDLVPVHCTQYTQALENALMGDTGIRAWPDSSVVNSIRKSLGLPDIAEPDPAAGPCPPGEHATWERIKPFIHEPWCNLRCRPGVHIAPADDEELEHIHLASLSDECRICAGA